MKKTSIIAVLAVAGALAAGAAQARDNVYWSIGINAPLDPYGASIGTTISNGQPYYAPSPVYYAPAPVYYAPPPVYYRPVPVYVGGVYGYGPGWGHHRHWQQGGHGHWRR